VATAGRAFKVIQNGAETFYKQGNLIPKHTLLGKHSRTPNKKAEVIKKSPQVRQLIQNWQELCPCKKAGSSYSSLISDVNVD